MVASVAHSLGVRAMYPAPLDTARAIAPALAGLDWGIGGSLLMWRLGIESAPRDLDIMTTASDFATVCERLSTIYGTAYDSPHPTYRSAFFARFGPTGPAPIDVFADVKVETVRGLAGWCFDPARVEREENLPWMYADDWVELYELFARPSRVRALKDYLSTLREAQPRRPNRSLERTRGR
jgi:hypothetical protein